MRKKKTAQIALRIDADVKHAAEKAAVQDHRSLTSLVEKLLVKHVQKRRLLTVPRQPSKLAARTALKLAAREIDNIGDRSLPAEEHEGRKRRLVQGPSEFRDIRCDQPTRGKHEPADQKP